MLERWVTSQFRESAIRRWHGRGQMEQKRWTLAVGQTSWPPACDYRLDEPAPLQIKLVGQLRLVLRAPFGPHGRIHKHSAYQTLIRCSGDAPALILKRTALAAHAGKE